MYAYCIARDSTILVAALGLRLMENLWLILCNHFQSNGLLVCAKCHHSQVMFCCLHINYTRSNTFTIDMCIGTYISYVNHCTAQEIGRRKLVV